MEWDFESGPILVSTSHRPAKHLTVSSFLYRYDRSRDCFIGTIDSVQFHCPIDNWNSITLARFIVEQSFWGTNADTVIVAFETNNRPDLISYEYSVYDRIAPGDRFLICSSRVDHVWYKGLRIIDGELSGPEETSIDGNIGIDLLDQLAPDHDIHDVYERADFVVEVYLDEWDKYLSQWSVYVVNTVRGDLDDRIMIIDREYDVSTSDPEQFRFGASLHGDNSFILPLERRPGGRFRIVGGRHGVLEVQDDCLTTYYGALPLPYPSTLESYTPHSP